MSTELATLDGNGTTQSVQHAYPMSQAGAAAIAALTDEEFDRRLNELKVARDRTQRIQQQLMEPEVDYGVIPGTQKPTLLKPGAEKLCAAYRLAVRIEATFTAGDGETTPPLRYDAHCFLHLGTTDGPVIGEGHGTANSWERRYRYRRGERACPSCGKTTTLRKSKRDPEWYCWAKLDGCGATFPLDAPEIKDQVVGDIENPDPWDLAVTLLKMAEKRAHVDATLRTTATSGLFTQDMEDAATASPAQQEVRAEEDGKLEGEARAAAETWLRTLGEAAGFDWEAVQALGSVVMGKGLYECTRAEWVAFGTRIHNGEFAPERVEPAQSGGESVDTPASHVEARAAEAVADEEVAIRTHALAERAERAAARGRGEPVEAPVQEPVW